MGSSLEKLIGLLAVALGAVALFAPSAGAEMRLYEITDANVSQYDFAPQGLAVDKNSKDVYLAGSFFAGHIHKFSEGVETKFGSKSDSYTGVTFNPSNGTLYALDVASGNMEIFDAAETRRIGFFPVGSDSGLQIASDSAGNVYVPRVEGNVIDAYASDGTLLQTIDCAICPDVTSFSSPSALAFDGADNLYVADSGNERVIRFENEGGDPAAFASPTVVYSGSSHAVAVDAATGDVFVGGDDGSGYHVVGYDSAGEQIADFGSGLLLDSFGAFGFGHDQIAVDSTTGTVYVADGSVDSDFNIEIRVLHFNVIDPPAATIAPAGEATQTTATLNGAVNPNGTTVQECYFEYGTTTAYGQTVPCEQEPGFGADPAPVSAQVEGLGPETTYHYRLVASNQAGSSESEDEEFTTAIELPSATTGGAAAIAQSTATIAGAVNPNGHAVTGCRFEYGTTTAYGAQAPCPNDPGSGSSAVAEAMGLSGLSPATTYHYRLLAENEGGTSAGEDRSFTTLPNAPAATTGPASEVSPTLAKVSGTVNPEGPSTAYRFEYGTTTAYGQSTPVGNSSGSAAKAVSAALSDLKPGTTYHYRLVATNPGGTTNGADQSFTTQARPKGVLALPGTGTIKSGKVAVSLTCRGAEIAECQGILVLRARIEQGIRHILVKIGSADFDLSGGQSKAVRIALNGNGRKALSQAQGGSLVAIATAADRNRELRLTAGNARKR